MNSSSRDPLGAAPIESTRLATCLLVLGVMLAFGIRWRMADMPLERDEGEYALAGQLVLRGVPPFVEMDNMKLPGVYYAYAGLLAVCGETARGVHLGLALWTTLSALLVQRIGRRFLEPFAAAGAAVVFALLSVSPRVLGLAGHATHFVTLPALLGAWFLLRFAERESLVASAFAGLAFGCAFVMKQHAVSLVAFGLVFVAWNALRRAHKTTWSLAAPLAVFALAAALPYGVLVLYLWKLGVLERFWFWTFTYAFEYASAVGLGEALHNLGHTARKIFAWNAGFWLLAALGLVALLWPRAASRPRLFVIGYLVFAFLATCPGGQFRNHYFIVVFPAVAWLVGAGLTPLRALGTRFLGHRRASLLPSACLAGALALALAGHGKFWFAASPEEAVRALYGGNPFRESLEIGRWIRDHTREGERIGIIGSEPQICFYADRRSQTRFFYTYALMEEHPYAEALQAEFVRQMEGRPEIVVFVSVSASWLIAEDSKRDVLEWSRQFVKHGYELAAAVEIPGTTDSRFVDAPPPSWRPSAGNYVMVFRRKG